MAFPVEIWLRGDNHASTEHIESVATEPGSWTDSDVAQVLVAMLRALERARNPAIEPDRPIALRGFSWIVSPFEGGVLIALELTLGAVVGGGLMLEEAA